MSDNGPWPLGFTGGNPKPGFWGHEEVSDSKWYKSDTVFLFKMWIFTMHRKFYPLQPFAFMKHFRYKLQIREGYRMFQILCDGGGRYIGKGW